MAERRGETFVMGEAGGPTAAGPISFSTFILGLASTALIHMGEVPNPETGIATATPDLAQQSLSLLDLLETKTKGNLTVEEQKLFSSVLTDLRLKFVALKKS
jgi:hypothetical protein